MVKNALKVSLKPGQYYGSLSQSLEDQLIIISYGPTIQSKYTNTLTFDSCEFNCFHSNNWLEALSLLAMFVW